MDPMDPWGAPVRAPSGLFKTTRRLLVNLQSCSETKQANIFIVPATGVGFRTLSDGFGWFGGGEFSVEAV